MPALWAPAYDVSAEAVHRDEAALVLYEQAGRVVIHQADLAPAVVPDVRAAAEEIRARLDRSPELERLVVGPLPWTVQELVSLSLTINDGRWGDEVIGLELLAEHTPPARPATGRGSANNGGATSLGDAEVMGSLSKTEITGVIRRHMNQIRYCYQRELTKDPSLSGRIEIKFVIAADGSVSSADVEESTVGSDGVEECIVGRVRRFQFPPPEGGGIVVVRYPFVFSPG